MLSCTFCISCVSLIHRALKCFLLKKPKMIKSHSLKVKAQLCTSSVLLWSSVWESENPCQDSICSISYGLILWFHLLYYISGKCLSLSLSFSPVPMRSLVCTATGIPCVSDTTQGKDLISSLRRQIGIKKKLVEHRFFLFGKIMKEILSFMLSLSVS